MIGKPAEEPNPAEAKIVVQMVVDEMTMEEYLVETVVAGADVAVEK